MRRLEISQKLAICATRASGCLRASDHVVSEPAMRAHTLGTSAPWSRHERRAARPQGAPPPSSATFVCACVVAACVRARLEDPPLLQPFERFASDLACAVAVCGAHCTRLSARRSRAMPRRSRGLRSRLARFFGKANLCQCECSSGAATGHDLHDAAAARGKHACQTRHCNIYPSVTRS